MKIFQTPKKKSASISSFLISLFGKSARARFARIRFVTRKSEVLIPGQKRFSSTNIISSSSASSSTAVSETNAPNGLKRCSNLFPSARRLIVFWPAARQREKQPMIGCNKLKLSSHDALLEQIMSHSRRF